MKTAHAFAVLCLTLAVYLPAGSPSSGLELSAPVPCENGVTCFIQQYVDVAPGPEARDYRCGTATYDGHKGTDIRVSSLEVMRVGVAVRAAAPGRVMRTRDGMPDALVGKNANRATLQARECGNGVLIDHGEGWQTQYCHLRQASVRVRRGQNVARGTLIGLVGASGLAQFPHVHFAVRHRGQVIDPFTGLTPDGGCGTQARSGGHRLWSAAAATRLSYQGSSIIASGFAGAPMRPEQLERGPSHIVPAGRAASNLLLYVEVINLRAGDRIRIRAQGPGDFRIDVTSAPLPRNKARYVFFAGKKRRQVLWSPGTYQGDFGIIRDGAVVRRATAAIVF